MNDNALLYEKIVYSIKEKINSGELKAGDRLPTEMDLARQFSVSRITSKRALENLKAEGLIYRVRGSGSFVAEGPDESGRLGKAAEAGWNSRVIAVVIPFEGNSGGIMAAISGISEILKNKNYVMDLHCNKMTPEEEKRLLLELYRSGIGGIIYYPKSDQSNLDVMNTFYLEKYPLVCIDKYFESIPLSAVVSDNFRGMYEAVRYLIAQGHRKIAFVSDVKMESATSIKNRYFGYAQALSEHGLGLDLELVMNGQVDGQVPETGRAAANKLVGRGTTAICTVNDYVASFMINSLRALGVSVPDQVSVMGFDNLEFGQMLDTPLTTVQQDLYRMGKEAVRVLLNMIEHNDYGQKKIVLPAELIVRASVAEKS